MTRAIPLLYNRVLTIAGPVRPYRTVVALTVAALTLSIAAAVQVQAQATPPPQLDLLSLLAALLTPETITIAAAAPVPVEAPPPPPVDDSFMRPIDGEMLSGFGSRSDGWHSGLDIRGRTGDPIRASRKGTVTGEACGSGYGVCSMIDHGDGITTLYAHMSRKEVTGGPVERGQVIGYVGCTGSCETPHVHFEVRQGGTRMDPMGYL